MTEEQRNHMNQLFRRQMSNAFVSNLERETMRAYQAEHERMRQFIRNLADESRVYLESEE